MVGTRNGDIYHTLGCCPRRCAHSAHIYSSILPGSILTRQPKIRERVLFNIYCGVACGRSLARCFSASPVGQPRSTPTKPPRLTCSTSQSMLPPSPASLVPLWAPHQSGPYSTIVRRLIPALRPGHRPTIPICWPRPALLTPYNSTSTSLSGEESEQIAAEEPGMSVGMASSPTCFSRCNRSSIQPTYVERVMLLFVIIKHRRGANVIQTSAWCVRFQFAHSVRCHE